MQFPNLGYKSARDRGRRDTPTMWILSEAGRPSKPPSLAVDLMAPVRSTTPSGTTVGVDLGNAELHVGVRARMQNLAPQIIWAPGRRYSECIAKLSLRARDRLAVFPLGNRQSYTRPMDLSYNTSRSLPLYFTAKEVCSRGSMFFPVYVGSCNRVSPV